MLSQIFCAFLFSSCALWAQDYFPKDYESSRSNFIEMTAKLQTQYKNVEVNKFIVGENDLSVDSFFIPPQGGIWKKLLIISSGTHGPEAYAGSALQTDFIKNILPRFDLKATGILIIHALNAWGFKNHRRGTENNVNLNRNFELERTLFETKNQSYDDLKIFLEKRDKISSTFNIPALPLVKEMIFNPKVSQDSLTEAIGRGQYSSPTGINFGGRDFEPQTLKIIELFKRITPKFEEILHFDIHTGLGDRGVLHIITTPGINKKSDETFKRMFTDHNDKDMYELTKSDAKGFYAIFGDFAKIIPKINEGSGKIMIGITAEFGTMGKGLWGKIQTINRLIRENQGHFGGYANEEVKMTIQKDYLEVFNPSSQQWRDQVSLKGHYVLESVVSRFLNQPL